MKRGARFQQTLASQASFEKHSRKSKREVFLDHMEQVVPWAELLALVEPDYPKAGNGRQPVGLEIMLRTYFLQQVVQSVGPWHGRGILRVAGAAPLCRSRSGAAGQSDRILNNVLSLNFGHETTD
jgi:hypothetical protein